MDTTEKHTHTHAPFPQQMQADMQNNERKKEVTGRSIDDGPGVPVRTHIHGSLGRSRRRGRFRQMAPSPLPTGCSNVSSSHSPQWSQDPTATATHRSPSRWSALGVGHSDIQHGFSDG